MAPPLPVSSINDDGSQRPWRVLLKVERLARCRRHYRAEIMTLLHHLLDDRAARTPDTAAVRRREQTWTYAQLHARSVEYAHGLVAAGVRRGDRVVALGEHEPETVAMLFALSRIGAIQVVLGERTPQTRLARIIEDARPVLAVTERPIPGCRSVRFSELTGRTSLLPPEGISADPVGIIYTS
ncbi:MAG TPA: AMP-binding protein, partial [Pseudonocardiaceae bacterium]